jgi:hypothetical protein
LRINQIKQALLALSMQAIGLFVPGLALGFISQAWALPNSAGCGGSHGVGVPWKAGEAVLFRTSKLNVDADGAPNSYRVDGNGLSYTCDGVVAVVAGVRISPGMPMWQEQCRSSWAKAIASGDYSGVAIFGFATNAKGAPIVQGAGDPLPGAAYVSTTSVSIPGAPEGTQRRYVDATSIPYIVLPANFRKAWKIRPGSLAIVYRPKTGKLAPAVFADGGNLGEASVRLHQDLGSDPMTNKGGVQRAKVSIDDAVLTVVFPDRVSEPRADVQAWAADISKQGIEALESFGGASRFASCAK